MEAEHVVNRFFYRHGLHLCVVKLLCGFELLMGWIDVDS